MFVLQEVAVPEVLYEEVIEVDERVVLKQDSCQLPRKDAKRIVTGVKHSSIVLHRRCNPSHFWIEPRMRLNITTEDLLCSYALQIRQQIKLTACDALLEHSIVVI